MSVIKVKDASVNIHGLEVPMQPVLKAADRIWKEAGQELVVTSARDGYHSPGSLHYYGYAVDLRTNYFTDGTKRQVATELQDSIGPDYQIIVHETHIHVEYQRVLDELHARSGK